MTHTPEETRRFSWIDSTSPAVFCLVIFCILLFVRNFDYFNVACDKTGDHALIALGVEKAKLFRALTGPYSRHHFMHPGPLPFYLYAVGDSIFGFLESPYGRYSLLQLILSGVFIGSGMKALSRGLESAGPAYLLLVSAILIFPTANTSFFAGIWGPATLPCALISFMALTPAIFAGEMGLLFIWTLSAATLLSTHVGTAVIVLPLSAIAVVRGAALLRQRERRLGRKEKLALLSSFALLAIAALPPLIDAMVTPHGGNIGRIAHFILSETHRKAPLPAARYFLSFFTLDLGFVTLQGWIVFIVTASFPWLVKSRSSYFRNLRAMTVLASVLGFLGAMNIKGGLHPFVMWHLYGLVAVMLVMFLHSLARAAGSFVKTGTLPALALPALALPASAIIALALCLFSPQHSFPYRCVSYGRYDQLTAEINPKSGVVYMVANRSGALDWQKVAGAVLALYRLRVPVCVPDRLAFMFGDDLSCSHMTSGQDLEIRKLQVPFKAPGG